MAPARTPSRLARAFSWAILGLPIRAISMNIWLGAGGGDHSGTPGAGGTCTWYPLASTLRTPPLGPWVMWAGEGTGVAGTVHERDGRILFTPNNFWSERGVHGWEREVVGERQRGPYRIVVTPDGEAVLRRRHP